MYDRTSSLTEVSEVRQELFSKKARSLENIPPTQASLLQHAKRAVFQGGYIWGQTLLKQPTLPCPSRWGWQLENSRWVPYWTTLHKPRTHVMNLFDVDVKLVVGDAVNAKKPASPALVCATAEETATRYQNCKSR